MTETILIIGSGAREHAIAVALARSPQQPKLSCYGSGVNPGIQALCTDYETGDVTNVAAITMFAATHRPTLAVIGPEAPLAAGVADALWSLGIPVVGPTRALAQIESSKGFARDLLAKYSIPGNPFFQRFTSMQGVEDVITKFVDQHVIKDDGLAGGKGVKVCGDHLLTAADSLAFCKELTALGHPFVIEEKIEGEEFSLMSFSDGLHLKHMPAVQDHKRAYEGDKGPNTGGMGTYTDADGSLPFLRPSDIAEAQSINERVIKALHQECGEPYRGVLYGGFMVTRDGVKLIEYNARFGDPESLNLLTLLESDFVTICRAVVDQTLSETSVTFAPRASVCKYLVPEGYPDDPIKGEAVHVPGDLPSDVAVFLSAVDMVKGQLVATGSRTIAIVATSNTISSAEAICEEIVADVPGRFFHRKDIGTDALIAKRVEHMKELRS